VKYSNDSLELLNKDVKKFHLRETNEATGAKPSSDVNWMMLDWSSLYWRPWTGMQQIHRTQFGYVAQVSGYHDLRRQLPVLNVWPVRHDAIKKEHHMKSTENSNAGKKSRAYRFVVSRSGGAEYETDGLREEFEYRDLGLADATHGDFHAHIIKARHLDGGHNGLHRHVVNLQFAMVLKGWVSFYYAEHGEIRYEQGDAVTIPGKTLHELREYSEDLELLELTGPSVYKTIREDGSEMATPGQKERIEERTTGFK